MFVPAVKYDYNYNRSAGQGVARSARSVSASSNMSAQRKVASTSTRRVGPTPESTKNSTRLATREFSETNNLKKRSATKAVSSKTLSSKTIQKSVSNTKRKVGASGAVSSNIKKQAKKTNIDLPKAVQKKNTIQKPAEMKLTKPKVDPKLKAKAKSKAKVEGLKRTILLGTMALGFLFLICFRYTQINEKFNEVNSLKKELSSVKALNQQLGADIDSKTDLSYIERYAKYQLGMQKPLESQIVKIAYEKEDKISTPLVISEEKEESFIDKLINDFKNIID